jgi:phage pi2 protein 07
MIDKRVKIIKDTVAHRIPIGSIVKIKSDAQKTIRGKKCYNVLDYCCYVCEDDVQILSDQDILRPILNPTLNEKPKSKVTDTIDASWFDKYVESHGEVPKKIKKGDKVYAQNVTALTPNGTQLKANNGKFIFYEEKNGRFWLRREDKNDVNEYFCSSVKIN